MNGHRTRTFQNVRYDLVLNDDYFDKYDDFDPSGDKRTDDAKARMLPNTNTEGGGNEKGSTVGAEKARLEAEEKIKSRNNAIEKVKKLETKNNKKKKKEIKKKETKEEKLARRKKARSETKAARAGKAISNKAKKTAKWTGNKKKEVLNEFNKGAERISDSSLGVAARGIASGASSGATSISRRVKGDTDKKGHLNEIKNKESVFDLLKNEQELNKAEFGQLKTAMKDISDLERVIFKLSGQDSAAWKATKKGAALAAKGAKILGKGLFSAGKKGIGLINRIPGGKPMSARGALKMARGGGAILRKGSQGLKRGLSVLSSGGKGASKALGKAFSTGGLAAKQAAKRAAAAAAAASRALAKKMETPVNDEPGFCIWMFTNLPPCLLIKIFAPVCCCSALTEEKAESQAKRDRPRKARTV
jgi:hypothetical protein